MNIQQASEENLLFWHEYYFCKWNTSEIFVFPFDYNQVYGEIMN